MGERERNGREQGRKANVRQPHKRQFYGKLNSVYILYRDIKTIS